MSMSSIYKIISIENNVDRSGLSSVVTFKKQDQNADAPESFTIKVELGGAHPFMDVLHKDKEIKCEFNFKNR